MHMRKFEICDSGIPEVGLFPGEDCGGICVMEKYFTKKDPAAEKLGRTFEKGRTFPLPRAFLTDGRFRQRLRTFFLEMSYKT